MCGSGYALPKEEGFDSDGLRPFLAGIAQSDSTNVSGRSQTFHTSGGKAAGAQLMVIKDEQTLLSDHVDARPVTDDASAGRNDIVQLDPDHPGFRDAEYRARR